jgi:apolipoprotein N-acyltransferase
MNQTDKVRFTLAAASGLLLTASFPDLELSWLVWVALVPLLAALRNTGVKQSIMLGFVMGVAHYMTLLYWLAYTMRTYGYLPWLLCGTVLILFSIYLSLFVALFSAAIARLRMNPLTGLVIIPSLWVGLEFIRSFAFTGFPWGTVGHSQYATLHMIQIADTLGAYGVSFLIMLVNAAVFFGYLCFRKYDWKGHGISRRFVVLSLAASLLLVGFNGLYGSWKLAVVDRALESAPAKRVTVVQGNISQTEKWDPAFQVSTVETYLRLSRTGQDAKPDLIVWPETALPFYFENNVPLTLRVRKGMADIEAQFVVGSPSFARRINRIDYYNSAYLLGPDGSTQGKYNKSHLVPFGEYVPFKKWLPFLGKIVAHVGDFDRGNIGDTVAWGKDKLGILICYELIFPYISRAMVKNGATVLINITNDAWYGRSSAPYQHFSFAVFRAVENRRAMIRSANTGISGFVDPAGRILAATPLFEEAAATRNVPLLSGLTFYTRYGDVFASACLTAAMLLFGIQEVRRRWKKEN